MNTISLDLSTALRLFAGTPLSVLVALPHVGGISNGQISQKAIEMTIDRSDKTVNKALKLLQAYQLIVCDTKNEWALTDDGCRMRKLLLGDPDANLDITDVPGAEQNVPKTLAPQATDSKPPRANIPAQKDSESENFRRVNSSSSVNRFKNKRKLIQQPQQDTRAGGSGKIPAPKPGSRLSEEEVEANFIALYNHGIGGEAQKRLAVLEHVTPDYIHGHCMTTSKTGQAIYRIEHNWPVDQDWRHGQSDHFTSVPAEDEGEGADNPGQVVNAHPQKAAEDWAEALIQIQKMIRPAEYRSWVACLWLVNVEGYDTADSQTCHYTIGTANRFGYEWLERQGIAGLLSEILAEITGRVVDIQIVVTERPE